MKDIAAKEMGGHNILAVERFRDDTRWMIEYWDNRSGTEVRQFLTNDGYKKALARQKHHDIKIWRYAHVIEGHIIDFKPSKKRRY